MERITTSGLRQNIYQILDAILESGDAVEIERKGRLLRISTVEPPSRLARLPRRKALRGDPDAIVHTDWSATWKPKFP